MSVEHFLYTETVPFVDYPSVPSVGSSRLPALAWAVMFFVLLNALIAAMFRPAEKFQRFSYHTSYEEIREVIDRMKQDPRKKIVFVGGSVMWGDATPDPMQTIPAEFQQLLPPDVAAYNLGLIAGRPLDEFLLAYELRDVADLVIADYNYEFGLAITHERSLERSTYLRMQQLMTVHGHAFLEDVPETEECFAESGIVPPSTGGGWMEQFVQQFVSGIVPIVRMKDRVNDALFGQHPALLIERIGLGLSDLSRGAITLSDLVSAPEHRIDPEPWVSTGSTDEQAYIDQLTTERYERDQLLLCMTRAFATYAAETDLPFVAYLTPLNPAMFPDLSSVPVHQQNLDVLGETFGSMQFETIDGSTLRPEHFADSTHLTPAGNQELARILFERLRPTIDAL